MDTEHEKVDLLGPKIVTLVAALHTAVEVVIGVFKVSQRIVPGRFTIMGLDEEITILVRELSRVMKPYAQHARRALRPAAKP